MDITSIFDIFKFGQNNFIFYFFEILLGNNVVNKPLRVIKFTSTVNPIISLYSDKKQNIPLTNF